MMRILLDQKDWIELARVATDSPRAKPVYCEIDQAMKRLKLEGHQFPLSVARYMETWRIQKVRWRRDLAMVMAEYSDYVGLVEPSAGVRYELTRVLNSRLGATLESQISIVGAGFAHTCAGVSRNVNITPGAVPAGIEEGVKYHIRDDAVLIARVEEFQALAYEPDVLGHQEWADVRNKATEHERLFEQREAEHWSRIQRYAGADQPELERLMRVDTLQLFFEELGRLTRQAGLKVEQLDALWDRQVSVLDAVPSLRTLAALRAQLIRDRNRRAVANDYYDVMALQQGIPYCDVVSADKNWADLANRTDLPKIYRCSVVGKPKELLGVLRSIGT